MVGTVREGVAIDDEQRLVHAPSGAP